MSFPQMPYRSKRNEEESSYPLTRLPASHSHRGSRQQLRSDTRLLLVQRRSDFSCQALDRKRLLQELDALVQDSTVSYRF